MSPLTLRYLILIPIMIWVSYTDIRYSIIPNAACLFLLLVGALLPLWDTWDLLWPEMWSAVVITFALSFILYLLSQGAGDSKLLTGIAAIIGYRLFLVAVVAYLLAGAAAIVLLSCKKITRETRLPLAPAIATATLLCLVLS